MKRKCIWDTLNARAIPLCSGCSRCEHPAGIKARHDPGAEVIAFCAAAEECGPKASASNRQGEATSRSHTVRNQCDTTESSTNSAESLLSTR